MDIAQVSDIAAAWIRFECAARNRGTTPLARSAAMADFWAAELVMDLPHSDPSLLWAVIVEVWNRIDRSDEALVGALGAGPLEDLLSTHGEKCFQEIAQFCDVEPEFKTVLRTVWQNSMSPDLWRKVQELRGGPNL
jgi:hypothetical protein